MLALTGHPARRWEPKRLRLRLFSVAGRLARSARRTVLHLTATGRWTELLLDDDHRAAEPTRTRQLTTSPPPRRQHHPGPWNRRPPERPRPNCHTPSHNHAADGHRDAASPGPTRS